MRLLIHQFRKDFQQTWVVWALWFFFVLVQFALAVWTVNPSDFGGAGVYGQIVGMVPAIHAILVFVLIPLLVFQEPPVGTTASWLTRPMPSVTVLGSKLISFGILVLLPLIGQCVVLSAHHIVFGDVVFAGMEIALKELSWIALATGLAVLCPNFATFLVAAVGLYILQYFSGWLWSWVDLIHPAAILPAPTANTPFLGQSRVVAADILCIAFGLGVVFLQYLTRQTRRAITAAILGLIFVGAVTRYWPWDFVAFFSPKPNDAHKVFDASAFHFQPGPNHNLNEQIDPRGGKNLKTLMMQFAVRELPSEESLTLQSTGGEQTYPDGSKLTLKPLAAANGPIPSRPTVQFFFNRFQNDGSNFAAIDSAIGFLPILNQQFNSNAYIDVQDLFTIDSATFAKKGADLGTGTFHLMGEVGGNHVTAEIPLEQNSVFSDQSKRTTLTQILKTSDGVDLLLRQRTLNLLLAPANPYLSNAQPTYLLVNRKRNEALYAENVSEMPDPDLSNLNGLMSAFNLGDNRFEIFSTFRVSFHPAQVPPRPLPVPIDEAWLADAVLVRIEPESHGNFNTTVRLNDFALDGHTLPDGNQGPFAGPDLDALQKITLPLNASRAEVWRYITRILYLSLRQRNSNNNDPQVDMLAAVGPAHATDLLIAATTFNYFNYPHAALKELDLSHQDDAREMLFRLLPTHTDLLDLVVSNHWETLAKPLLLARLQNRQPGEHIDDPWLDVLALSHDDPKVKQAFLDLLPTQQDVIRIIIANHWELDAKPILISEIARSKPGSHVDERWVQVLDSFHDDSRVKAMLLRVLPSNQEAIETVVQNHWETDAKPIMLATLNAAKPGDNIDARWFRVLASLSDLSGVKEAVLRVLPFSHDAIDAVILGHWEDDAKPLIIATLAKAHPGDNVDDRWFQALDNATDQQGVKEAVLRVLPFLQSAIVSVQFHHWEQDAKPVMLATLDKAKQGDNIDGRWLETFNSLQDKRGVKEALLRVLPFIPNVCYCITQNHWEADARPIVLAVLEKAKPEDRWGNDFIGLASGDPTMAEFKQAIFHILPTNDEAIDFVTQNHWEKDAEPILLQKMSATELGEGINQKWIKALATVRDPSTYPLLLSYTEDKMNKFQNAGILEDIRPLPGPMVAALVARQWKAIRGNKDLEANALVPAVGWGVKDAFDRAAEILLEPRETDPQKFPQQEYRKTVSRELIHHWTPCPDRLIDADIITWYQAHKSTFDFDPILVRYLPNPATLPADQSWPTLDDSMKAIGQRAAAGDPKAFADLEAAADRAATGLDPKRDGDKIRDIRYGMINSAFNVLRDGVAKNPAILSYLEAANHWDDLKEMIVTVYGRAAENGNDQALDALLHYQAHQWALPDVLNNLENVIAKQNAQAIDFVKNLTKDPNFNVGLLDRASGELVSPANAGNEQARDAYRALRQSSL